MKIYIYGPDDRQESKDLMLRIADSVSKKHEIVNVEDRLECDLYKAEKADALVLRLDCYDDATWSTIGMARAGNRPIIPFWGASWEYPDAYSSEPVKVYGFMRDTHKRNRKLIREEDDKRKWPSSSAEEIVEDIEVLEQKKGWREARIKKPGKETVNLDLPVYITGDSRQWWDHLAYYLIESALNANGISSINPSRDLDNYTVKDFPDFIYINPKVDGAERCHENAGPKSSMILSRGIHIKNLMGARFEGGIAWFNSHPILYLNSYTFPSRKSPQEKYEQGKNPGMHLKSIFDQNKELWNIEKNIVRTAGQAAEEICKLRGVEYSEPGKVAVVRASLDVIKDVVRFSLKYSRT